MGRTTVEMTRNGAMAKGPQATAPILDSTNCDIRAIYNSAKAGTKRPRTMPGLKVCWRWEIRSVPPDGGAIPVEAAVDARSDHIAVTISIRVGAEYAAPSSARSREIFSAVSA